MDPTLLDRAARFAPQWLRYVLALSEIVRTGEGWVVASGDDVALFEAGGESVLPLWPAESLAADWAVDGAEPSAVGVSELVERLLPAIGEGGAKVAVFPSETRNALAPPDAVARDLAGFAEQPRDVAAELASEARPVALEVLAVLDTPGVADIPACPAGGARYWLLSVTDEEAVVGLVDADVPALLLFADEPHALAFALRAGAPATPTPVAADSLDAWMLLAFSAGWGAAIVDSPSRAMLETAAHLALAVAEEQAGS